MELKCSDDLRKLILDMCYPIGHIWVSMNSTNPKSIVGGTWIQITGKFLYCNTSSKSTGGGTKTESYSGDTGGCYLGWRHLPSQVIIRANSGGNSYGNNNWDGPRSGWGNYPLMNFAEQQSDTGQPHYHSMGSHSHNQVLPPYITCYAWYRTA